MPGTAIDGFFAGSGITWILMDALDDPGSPNVQTFPGFEGLPPLQTGGMVRDPSAVWA